MTERDRVLTEIQRESEEELKRGSKINEEQLKKRYLYLPYYLEHEVPWSRSSC